MIDPSSTIHVLSIEDDIDFERLIGVWLHQAEPLRFQVTPAERLSDVARHFELGGYDCMLLDLGLPDSMGLETLTSAREIAAELPIVVLTAADDYEVAEQSMRFGADDYLVKGSFGPDALIETIVAAVDARRSADSFDPRIRSLLSRQVSGIPLSAQIAAELPTPLASTGQWLDRCRRASGVPL